MAGQKPRQGWIYVINPAQVCLRCKAGHIHSYELPQFGDVQCKTNSCNLTLNSSRVFRGTHPYLIWTSDPFQDESGYLATFTVIPLTSQETFKGLPTTYPINSTARNGIDKNSLALVHQISTVDANCLKDSNGNWLVRIGQLDKSDKEAIETRLKYYLGMSQDPSQDWFEQNASPELIQKVFEGLSKEERLLVIDQLIDGYGL